MRKSKQTHQCCNGPSLCLPPHFMSKTETHWSRAFPGCRHISDDFELFILGRWPTRMQILLGNKHENESLECSRVLSASDDYDGDDYGDDDGSCNPRILTPGRVTEPITCPFGSSKLKADSCQRDANLRFIKCSRNLETFLAFIS